MNWTPDKEIEYAVLYNLAQPKTIIQSNYLNSYKFWAMTEPVLNKHDVALWRLKSLKPQS